MVVTADGVWIANRIYVNNLLGTRDYNLHTSVHSHDFNAVTLYWLPSLQRRTLLFLWTAELSPFLSHSNCSSPLASYTLLITTAQAILTQPSIYLDSRFQPIRQSYLTSDGQSVSLSWYQAIIWDPRQISLSQTFSSEMCGSLSMWRPLWREDGVLIYSYNCYWSLPALSHSGPSTAEHETLSCCLIWEWIPTLSPLTTRKATVEVF
jgi:hypothetical protein